MFAAADLADISFFELDRLFTDSARALRRRQRRRRLKEKQQTGEKAEASRSRSRGPHLRRLRFGGREIPQTGGFTSKVEKVEHSIVITGAPVTADERAYVKHFIRCGGILDVKICRTRQDKPTGVVIIEFEEEDGVANACSMVSPENEMLGTVLKVARGDLQLKKDVKPKQITRENVTQQVLSGLKFANAPPTGANMRKLHIKNLRPVVTEGDMRGIFKPFAAGDFEKFQMGDQECWITFESHSDAQDAMTSMQGFSLVGQELVIIMLNADTPPPMPAPQQPELMDLKGDTDFGGGTTAAGGEGNAARLELMGKLMASHREQGVPTVVTATAPTPEGEQTAEATAAAAAAAAAAAKPPETKPGGPTSKTLLLQNMFTPANVDLQQEPKFYEEIREDTNEECAKFGKVLHVTVDPRGEDGRIYVLYESASMREAAEAALNGRWFEGKKIAAQGIDDSIWEALAAQAAAPAKS